MKQESLPPMKEVYDALEEAAVDLYGFGVVCMEGVTALAEPAILDTLLLGLENLWFRESMENKFTYKEFREDFFRALWEKCQGRKTNFRIGSDVPLGHAEMPFYRMPQLARAAIYLRTKKHFSYASVAMILGVSQAMVEEEIERCREFLLGRRVAALQWTEEDF